MKLGIMQPYFLPYIGYWQLLNAVDTYVLYDDVNFIKGGWINRNRFLMNGQPFLFTVPLEGMSPFKKINEIGMSPPSEKLFKTLQQAYGKAPYFSSAYPLIDGMLRFKTRNLAEFIINSIRATAGYMGVKTKLLISSEIEKDDSLSGQDKVLNICERLGATEYYNAIGGLNLYSYEAFTQRGIRLSFLKTDNIHYPQYKNDFVPGLSILDVLMFNSQEDLRHLLGQYSLINNRVNE